VMAAGVIPIPTLHRRCRFVHPLPNFVPLLCPPLSRPASSVGHLLYRA
jgi:hypothetical protein